MKTMGLDSSQEGSLEGVIVEVILKIGYDDGSLLVPLLKLLRAAWDSEVMVPVVYPDKVVVMGVVGPGGAGLDLPIILIMSTCLKSLNCSLVKERRSSA